MSKGKLIKYYIITGLMALILSPLVVSIGLIGILLIVPPILLLVLVWIVYSKRATLPEKASEIFLPIFLAFAYYMCVWIVVFGLSGYRFESEFFKRFFNLLTRPYFVLNFFFAILRNYSFFPIANAIVSIITILCIVAMCAEYGKKIVWDKSIIIYGVIFLCLSGIAGYQHYDRSTQILARDYRAERVEDEVELYQYRPFRTNNLLRQLSEPATISFDKNYPRLDGATAAYPVYGAMVQELYRGLDQQSVEEYVACSKTDEAYERLIRGEIDIFFGAQPSKQQIESANEKGVELVLTPIAKEAFVFFVNKENPVSTLTLEQIQDIYQKRLLTGVLSAETMKGLCRFSVRKTPGVRL